MKCKVKGLVFVGFAAAILAGAAHAAGENIVTSKAYTDATYQAKTAANNAGKILKMASNDAGDIGYTAVTSTYDTTNGLNSESSNLVTEGAVADAIAAVQDTVSGSGYEVTSNRAATIDNTMGSATTYPTTGAVVTYVDNALTTDNHATYQTYSTTAQQVSDGAGGWQALTKDTTVTQNSSNPVTSGAVYSALNGAEHANFQTYSETANQISNGAGGWKNLDSVIDSTTASSASAPTTAAVKTYVDNQANTAASNILTGTQDATDTSHALTNAATTTALAGKQDNLGGTGNAGKVVTASETEGSVTYTAIDTAVTSGSSNLVTSDAVYDALNGAEHSNFQTYSTTAHQISNGAGGWEALDATINATTAAAGTAPTTGAVKSYVDSAIAAQPASNIPAQNPAICTNTEPCALVSENGNYNWRVMAVSSNQTSPAGTCGNVGGQCPTTAPANNG